MGHRQLDELTNAAAPAAQEGFDGLANLIVVVFHITKMGKERVFRSGKRGSSQANQVE